MKVNFSAVIQDLDGTAVPIPKKNAQLAPNGMPLDPTDTEDLTLARTAILALMQPDDKRSSPEAKLDEFELAIKIKGGGEVDITAEQAKLLQERIAVRFPSFIVSGRAAQLLKG